MYNSKRKALFAVLIGLASCFPAHFALAQTISLGSLNDFKSPPSNWKVVGDATVQLDKENAMTAKAGEGILMNTHQKGKYGSQYELVSKLQHGDLDLEMDFMMAKGSNSGIYLQGNYEVQLLDSWGKKSVNYGDCGGIYHRWDDARPEGEKGYEGYGPRYNVAKAPGLWQHIKISYQAPRFDANGNKIANARFLKVELNGITIHDNVEVSGPTRGAMSAKDVAFGPIRIQGDHGSLAIRNLTVNNFDKKPGVLKDLTYKTYYGSIEENADLSQLTPAQTGSSPALTWEVLNENNNFSLVYNGQYEVATAGTYHFKLQAAGNSYLKIDGKTVLPTAWKNSNERRTVDVELTAGQHTIEILNNKRDGWLKPSLGLWVSGPGFREVGYNTKGASVGGGGTDPILIEATSPTVTRSFMDFRLTPKSKNHRVVHAVSVGNPANIHYTYDMDNGAVFQVWRGDFLDATPMWHSRGDGSSRPLGSVERLGDEMLLGMAPKNAAWVTDTTGSQYRPKGYELDENGIPTFRYEAFGTNITDHLAIVDGKYLERTLTQSQVVGGLTARVAQGTKIEKVANNLYAVNDKSYYIQLDEKAEIRTVNGQQELLVPLKNKETKYAILF
ncbi:PA14 domain-containing protein [Dyadobacter jejuensis]|uniref:PA14 domain-containing protein n=1 Tax=Dyadobacter jejuensis TaxID=1082580 RepID=A0A316AQ65_9BACT|nr:family 16 glycoside hydrolase [Dyadobacter jejuensis]PWJ59566.1 PA14 domain-containing protein [Dyadobacter jejuensis]